MTNDDVVHPDHYNQYEGFEVIDICRQLRSPDGWGQFERGNAFKYLARAGWKSPDTEVQDLEKAIYYIQLEIDRLKVDQQRQAAYDEQQANQQHAAIANRPNLSDEMQAMVDDTVANLQAGQQVLSCRGCDIIITKSVYGPDDIQECPNGHGLMDITDPSTFIK